MKTFDVQISREINGSVSKSVVGFIVDVKAESVEEVLKTREFEDAINHAFGKKLRIFVYPHANLVAPVEFAIERSRARVNLI